MTSDRSTNLPNQCSIRSKDEEESNTNERPRPKGTQINGVVCHNPLRIIDLNQSKLMTNSKVNCFQIQEYWYEQRKNYPEPSTNIFHQKTFDDNDLFFSLRRSRNN